jgi:hypothetical protein
MRTMEIDILNPKAGKLIKDLADLNFIAIRKTSTEGSLLTAVKKIRAKAKSNPPTLAEITKEVEIVRAKRYAKAK